MVGNLFLTLGTSTQYTFAFKDVNCFCFGGVR